MEDRKTISFTSLSNHNDLNYFLRSIASGRFQKLELDLSKVQKAYPNILVPIAGYLDYLQVYLRKDVGVFYGEKNFLRKRHIQHPSSWQDTNSIHTATNAVWKFQSDSDIHKISEAITKQLRQTVETVPGFLIALNWILSELMDNALRHSNVQSGFIMCQAFSQNQRVAVCIFDYGIGIFKSLSSSGEHKPRTPLDAIKMAFQKGITKGDGQGFGLYGTINLVKLNKGYITVSSNGYGVRIDEDGNYHDQEPHKHIAQELRLPWGCYIEFQLDFRKPIDVIKALDGHKPINLSLEDYQDDLTDSIVVKVSESESGHKTRPAGVPLRKMVYNFSQETSDIIVIDFNDVVSPASSFIDEFLARLVIDVGGISKFYRRFRIINMSDYVKSLFEIALQERLSR